MESLEEKIKAHAKQADEGWGLGYGFFSKVINDHVLKTGAEVGVAFGGHSEAILQKTKVEKLYGVDPYRHESGYDDAMNLPQKEFDELFRFTVKRLAVFGGRYQHVRKPSKEAAAGIPGLLDFVYLDGDHSYKGVMEDLCAWFSKIRDGGIIGGHDYGHMTHPGVKKAVDEFFRRFDWTVHVEGEGVWWVKKEALSISFFMPAYNCEKFIRESVESIMDGNFTNGDELVIVNDGSTDGTAQVLGQLKAKYPVIKVFHHPENRGGAVARNTAIGHARHQILFCLDSDNLLARGSIAKLKDFLLGSASDAAAFSIMRYFNNETKKVTGQWEFKKPFITLEYYLTGEDTPGYGGNYMFTKESWRRAGGYPEGNWLDTWGFGLRQLATDSRIGILKDSYYMHRHGHYSYYQRESKKGDISRMAFENIKPFLHLINQSDAEYVTRQENTWFDALGRHPLRLTAEAGKHFYQRDYFIDPGVSKKSWKSFIKARLPRVVGMYGNIIGRRQKEAVNDFHKTSISDADQQYIDVCNLAASDQKAFGNFRNNKIYREIVETVSQKQGQRYLEMIVAKNPEFVTHFGDFRKNDAYGSPVTYEYGAYGAFAPTTLRYIKVLSDLTHLFGSLDGMRIIEIGVGYGGQCNIISDVYDVASYTLVDLPGPLALAEKYLGSFGVKKTQFTPFDKLPGNLQYDILISNYAFSECTRQVQDVYVQKAFKNSQRGYLLWNFLAKREGIDTFDVRELKREIPGSMVIAAKPYSFSENRIFFWDHTKKVFSESDFYADRMQVFFENIIPDMYGGMVRFLRGHFPRAHVYLKKIIKP